MVAAACVGLALAGGGFETTAYAAAALAVWAAVVVGLATGTVPRSEPPRPALAAGLCLAGFAGLTALSLAWADDDGQAFADLVRALAYLGIFALVVVASRRGEARPWLAGLAVGLAAIGAIALLARFQPGVFGDPDADLRQALPATSGRLAYPIGYWNGLAAALAGASALLAWFGANANARSARVAAIAALPMIALALWATDSRGGVAAAALALGVLVVAGPRRTRLAAVLALGAAAGTALIAFAATRDALFETPGTAAAAAEADGMLAITLAVVAIAAGAAWLLERPFDRLERLRAPRLSARRRPIAAIAAALAVLALIVAADPVERFEEFKQPPQGTELRVSGQADLLRSGGTGRYQFWEAAVDSYAEAPLGGVGSGDYGSYWLERREVGLAATRAHSLFFESLAELGVAGLVAIAGFFAVAGVAGVRRSRPVAGAAAAAPALAVLVVGFVAAAVDWTWDLPAVFGVAVIAAALLTGPATLARRRRRHRAGVRHRPQSQPLRRRRGRARRRLDRDLRLRPAAARRERPLVEPRSGRARRARAGAGVRRQRRRPRALGGRATARAGASIRARGGGGGRARGDRGRGRALAARLRALPGRGADPGPLR